MRESLASTTAASPRTSATATADTPARAKASRSRGALTTVGLRAAGQLVAGSLLWFVAKLLGLIALALHHPGWAAVIFFAPDPWMFWQIAIPSSRGFGPVFTRFETARREVWLTIDDGPHPASTPQILDLLDRFGARATFFVIGERVDQFPELAREIVARGHTVANHSMTHPVRSFWAAGPGRNRAELDACAQALARAETAALPLFRPPVGLKNPWLHPALAERDLACVNWSARGYDRILKLDTAAARIANQLRPGAIVLLHDGDARSVRVVERVLETLREKKFTSTIPTRESLRQRLARLGAAENLLTATGRGRRVTSPQTRTGHSDPGP